MKIVADKDIPFLEGVFEPYADVVYKQGGEISREDVMDADVLIVHQSTLWFPAHSNGWAVCLVLVLAMHPNAFWIKSTLYR